MEGRTLSHPRFQVDSLDGLRGFAVLLVIVSHSSNQGLHIIPWVNFSGIGSSGVYLFFILSAFLLTYPFILKGEHAFRVEEILKYSVRRFFRIYPLYFVYITLSLITSLVLWRLLEFSEPKGVPLTLDWAGYLNQLFMISGEGVTWSIPIEFQYYFILPVTAYLFACTFKRSLLPSFIFVVVVVLLATRLWPTSLEETERARSLGYFIPIFVTGSFLALIHYNWLANHHDRKTFDRFVELTGWIAVCLIILLIPSVAVHIFPGFSKLWIHRQFTLFACLWGVILFAAINGSGLIRYIFEQNWLRNIGFVSFSAYLIHPVVIKAIKGIHINSTISAWLVIVITLALSVVSYRLIEKPTSRIRYTLGRLTV